MPVYQFKLQRMFFDADLKAGSSIELNKEQHNYLANVLRAKAGFEILLFNGRDGEWLGTVMVEDQSARRPKLHLRVSEQLREQTSPNDLRYLFAPIKQARQDYMVQKAVEMGVSELVPVRTEFCQISKINKARMMLNAQEACEQCGVLNLPKVHDLKLLEKIDELVIGDRTLVFCDERAPVANPSTALASISQGAPVSVLIGPEGGFSDRERQMLLALENAVPIALGPRILRADTAAVAAIAAVQMILGDWQD